MTKFVIGVYNFLIASLVLICVYCIAGIILLPFDNDTSPSGYIITISGSLIAICILQLLVSRRKRKV